MHEEAIGLLKGAIMGINMALSRYRGFVAKGTIDQSRVTDLEDHFKELTLSMEYLQRANNSEEKQNDQPAQVKSSADATVEQITAYIDKEIESLRRGCGSNTWDILEGLQKLLFT